MRSPQFYKHRAFFHVTSPWPVGSWKMTHPGRLSSNGSPTVWWGSLIIARQRKKHNGSVFSLVQERLKSGDCDGQLAELAATIGVVIDLSTTRCATRKDVQEKNPPPPTAGGFIDLESLDAQFTWNSALLFDFTTLHGQTHPRITRRSDILGSTF